MGKKQAVLYIVLCLLICLVPSAGILFFGLSEPSENQDPADAPELIKEDGTVNEYVLSDAGSYFEDHFALRNELVTGYSCLAGDLLRTSAQESVVMGNNGWLFYAPTMDDYLGLNQPSDRQLYGIARKMAMMQEYCEQNGAEFVFTIAPDKSFLYGEYLPYYDKYFRNEENSGLLRLKSFLEKEEVNYVDLYELLSGQDEILYHQKDTHWTSKGAAIAADALLTAAGTEHKDYTRISYEIRSDFEGDLSGILYPAKPEKCEEVYYSSEPEFSYQEEVENNFAPSIDTTGSGETGSLLMYRDSFGNALLPFMAEAYSTAHFSRYIPYNLLDLITYGADTVIVERAQRFLTEMVKEAPSMQAPFAEEVIGDEAFSECTPDSVEDDGFYTTVRGELEEGSYGNTSRIYIRVNGIYTYEACPVTLENGKEGYQMMTASSLMLAEGNEFEIACQE